MGDGTGQVRYATKGDYINFLKAAQKINLPVRLGMLPARASSNLIKAGIVETYVFPRKAVRFIRLTEKGRGE